MPSLTYSTYCSWFLAHYGRPFAASEAEYEAALRQPPFDIRQYHPMAQYSQADYNIDIDKERRGDL